VLLCLKTGTQLAPEMSSFFKKLDEGQSPKKENYVSNFSRAFPLLDFLTLEEGTNRLSQNVWNELSLHAVQYLRRAEGSRDNLVMQALV
jgi:hypothetical protein